MLLLSWLIDAIFCFSFGLSNKFETEFPQGLSAKVIAYSSLEYGFARLVDHPNLVSIKQKWPFFKTLKRGWLLSG